MEACAQYVTGWEKWPGVPSNPPFLVDLRFAFTLRALCLNFLNLRPCMCRFSEPLCATRGAKQQTHRDQGRQYGWARKAQESQAPNAAMGHRDPVVKM